MKQKRIVNAALLGVVRRGKCLICLKPNPDVHHVKSKKSGGHDILNNLMPLCREHHTEIHKIGLSKASDKYENVKGWLLNNHWEFSNILMRWILPTKGGYIP
jgi:5-methylcytosine-specific restriction endonuclease McrA